MSVIRLDQKVAELFGGIPPGFGETEDEVDSALAFVVVERIGPAEPAEPPCGG